MINNKRIYTPSQVTGQFGGYVRGRSEERVAGESMWKRIRWVYLDVRLIHNLMDLLEDTFYAVHMG